MNETDINKDQAQTARESEISLKTEGQRNTSMLWEVNQKDLAKMALYVALSTASVAALFGKWLNIQNEIRFSCFVFLFGAANIIIGFYFGRTNHQRVGGPGGDSAGTR